MKKISLLLLCLLSTSVFAQETLREHLRERFINRMEQQKTPQNGQTNNITTPNQNQQRPFLANRNQQSSLANNQNQTISKESTPLPSGVKSLSINVNGQTRYYYEYNGDGDNNSKPNHHEQNYENKNLILIYHGGGGSAPNFMNQTKFINLNPHKNILVFLNAEDKNWYDGRTGMESRKDIDFTNAVINTYKNKGVKQIMATGFSNGAIFTLRLACEHNTDIDVFAAIQALLQVV